MQFKVKKTERQKISQALKQAKREQSIAGKQIGMERYEMQAWLQRLCAVQSYQAGKSAPLLEKEASVLNVPIEELIETYSMNLQAIENPYWDVLTAALVKNHHK